VWFNLFDFIAWQRCWNLLESVEWGLLLRSFMYSSEAHRWACTKWWRHFRTARDTYADLPKTIEQAEPVIGSTLLFSCISLYESAMNLIQCKCSCSWFFMRMSGSAVVKFNFTVICFSHLHPVKLFAKCRWLDEQQKELAAFECDLTMNSGNKCTWKLMRGKCINLSIVVNLTQMEPCMRCCDTSLKTVLNLQRFKHWTAEVVSIGGARLEQISDGLQADSSECAVRDVCRPISDVLIFSLPRLCASSCLFYVFLLNSVSSSTTQDAATAQLVAKRGPLPAGLIQFFLSEIMKNHKESQRASSFKSLSIIITSQ